jgi:hypothetical protein
VTGARPVRSRTLVPVQLLSHLGPFFAVSIQQQPPQPPWRPLATLAEPGALDERIAEVRRALDCSPRVAASVAQLGLVARLVSPALGAAVELGSDLDLAAGHWKPPLGSTFELAVPPPSPTVDPVAGLQAVLDGPVAAVSAECARRGRVSPRVLRGNVAAALNGAALLLGPRSYPLAGTVLAGIPGERTPVGAAFARNSCCLIYRAPGRGRCADCVLRRA